MLLFAKKLSHMDINTPPEDSTPPLTAREVCQLLREVTFERRTMAKVGDQTSHKMLACSVMVDIEGWLITLHYDHDQLDHCEECVSPEGQRWRFGPGARFGTDPVALLSTWEQQALERLVKAL